MQPAIIMLLKATTDKCAKADTEEIMVAIKTLLSNSVSSVTSVRFSVVEMHQTKKLHTHHRISELDLFVIIWLTVKLCI